ncbi:MAG: glycosyltransferase family 9 protein [Deltaproteobacteria bacterium]|nr:glycosyltransferase family 9 protein [Deltaproteobacteria bacterium]MBW2154016.1 glycosyltransferase family 9 protein [Deltaproteobacteria bacterium]
MAKRLLIIRWSGMGDVIMTLPAVNWLKNHLPDAYICYFTERTLAKIPEKSGLVQRVETIDRRAFRSVKHLFKATVETMATMNRLRKSRFDMVFDLQGFGETSVLAYLTGAPVRVGRIKNSALRRRLYTVAIQADWEREHRSMYFMRAICEAIGVSPPTSVQPPWLPKLRETIDLSVPRIGLNLGASTQRRRWSEQNFFRLADNLSSKGMIIRVFLGPQESFLFPTVKRMCDLYGWELAAFDDIEALIQALSECRVLISNDTGPGHLAAALGISVITLFSTGAPQNVRPLAKKAKWFRNEKDINRIAVREVENACFELLSQTEP